MRCKEAYVCLLAAQSPDTLPLELHRHLQRCASCQRRLRRLHGLAQECRQLPLPEAPPHARQAILDQLERRAVVALPAVKHAAARLDSRTWRGRVALFAAAAVILFVVGLGLGWSLPRLRGPHELAVQDRTPLPSMVVAHGAKESVVGRILESDLRLAEVSTAPEQLAALADIATELRREALRLAREGPVEDLMLVGGLYERVVLQGMVARARALPVEHWGLVGPLMEQLEQSARAAEDAAAAALPGAGEGLRALAATARAASRSLTVADAPAPELRAPSWQPARSGTLRDLLGTLVVQGLRLADEGDPLRRADCCNDVAEHIVQGILLASSGGDTDRAERLGGFLGSVMDRGIGTNLERFHADRPEHARMVEAEKIGGRSIQAVAVLEKNLEKAPAVAQPGLQKALEASKKKKDKEPRGKGKGKDRSDKPLPPGLEKKLNPEPPEKK